jgi:hypothetical protein
MTNCDGYDVVSREGCQEATDSAIEDSTLVMLFCLTGRCTLADRRPADVCSRTGGSEAEGGDDGDYVAQVGTKVDGGGGYVWPHARNEGQLSDEEKLGGNVVKWPLQRMNPRSVVAAPDRRDRNTRMR